MGTPADIVFLAPWRLLAAPAALILVAIVGAAALLAERRSRRTRFIRERVFTGDLPHLGARAAAFAFLACTALVLALAWAKPVLVTEVVEERRGGIRVAYLPDVSLSMDARDVPEGNGTTSRIAATRAALRGMEESLALPGGRAMPQTVIPFAGSAHLYGGFTESRTHLGELFSVIATKTLITARGSDLVGAFTRYRELLDEHPAPEGVTDIAILFSDGGNDPGGHVIDIGALEEVLGTLKGRATIYAVGYGGDTPVEIPDMLPDGTWDGVLRREGPEDAKKEPEPGPYDWADETGRTMRPREEAPKKPTGDPWTTAFDEEIMALVASEGGACIRIVAAAQTSVRGRHCERVADGEILLARLTALVRAKERPLPPEVRRETTPIERYFVAVGITMLFLSLFFERTQAILRRQRERPMHTLLFDETAE